MPITFNCPCGKSLRVADEHAGKRIKCPGCQAIGTAPKAEPKFEVIEDKPKEQLAAPPAPAKPKPTAKPVAKPAPRDEEDDAGFTVEEDEDEKPKPKKKPTFSKGSRKDEDEEEEDEPKSKKKKKPRRDDDDDDEDDRPRRRRPSDPDAGKKIMYLIGGLVLALVGVAVAFWWWQNEPHTGRRPYSGYIFGACAVIVGIGTSIKGITGNFGDDE